MATGMKTLRIAKATYNKTTRAHGAWNNTHLALFSRHCALASHPNRLTKMLFLLHVIMVAIHRFFCAGEGYRDFPRQGLQGVLHHHFAVYLSVALRPVYRRHIIIKVFGAFF